MLSFIRTKGTEICIKKIAENEKENMHIILNSGANSKKLKKISKKKQLI